MGVVVSTRSRRPPQNHTGAKEATTMEEKKLVKALVNISNDGQMIRKGSVFSIAASKADDWIDRGLAEAHTVELSEADREPDGSETGPPAGETDPNAGETDPPAGETNPNAGDTTGSESDSGDADGTDT